MLYKYATSFIEFFIGFSLGILLCDFFERKHPTQFKQVKNFIFNRTKTD